MNLPGEETWDVPSCNTNDDSNKWRIWNFISPETLPDKDYIGIGRSERDSSPGAKFVISDPINSTGAEPRAKTNPGKRTEKADSEITKSVPNLEYHGTNNKPGSG